MGGEVLVVAAAHVGDEDVAVDQRVVEPGAAEPGTGRTDPAQLPGAGEQLGRHRAVGGVGIGDVVEGVLRIAVRVNDDARHCAPDFLGPRGVGIGCQQQDLEAHRRSSLHGLRREASGGETALCLGVKVRRQRPVT